MKINKLATSLVVAICGLIIFSGCTGFNQDPMKDQDISVQNAKDPTTKPGYVRPITSDAIKLDVVNGMTFKEGQIGVLPLKAKSFLTGYNYTFEVENLAAFKGAILDVSNQFVWTPPAGTIDAGQFVKVLQLKVFIVATPIGGSSTVTLKSETPELVTFFVQNDMKQPIAKAIKFSTAVTNPTMFEEESVRYMTLTAEDSEGSDIDGMRPTLSFNGKISPYITVTSTRYLTATSEWEFEIKADLINVDITKGMEAAPVSIQVVNRYGQVSLPLKVDFTVLTKLSAAATTFDNTVILKAGVLNSIPFTIYDSKNESILTLVNSTTLPTGAQVNCEKSIRTFQQCSLVWTPSATDVGAFTSTLEIETKGSNPLDTRPAIKSSVSISYKVAL